jgi:Na+/H+ antiporter NhaD/arsenite permease-like protein
MIPIIILAVVFLLIAVRQIGRIRLQIWQIMAFGAVAVLITGQISPLEALKSIDIDVILFLFGMFIIGQALEESGYLSYLSSRLFSKAKSLDILILMILFGMGIASAFLMNDTLAIIGTPVILLLARKNGIHSRILLLTLAFAITIGSVMSPIGNPQNLLIAISGNVQNPFITFFKFLFIPSIINLIFTYALLRLFYRRHFIARLINNSEELIRDNRLVSICKVSLLLLVLLMIMKIMFVLLQIQFDLRLTYIALISALPVIVLSPERFGIMRKLDWFTLIFFTAMFILMQSVWDTGFFQSRIVDTRLNIISPGAIFSISTLLSQLISNVPLVALYLPLLSQAGANVPELMMLAAGSTIAGNLTILGAASNVIIIQNAERKCRETITFLEFIRIGVPLTVINILVYWLYFLLF